jgi:hypothetical protein
MKRILAFALALAAFTLASCGGANTDDMRIVSAAQSNVVTPANPGAWTFTEFAGGTVDFASNPAGPGGTGDESLLFTAGDYPSGADAISRDFAGLKISDIDTLTYSTYVTSFTSGQAPYLVLNVDKDADGTCDTTLFFEPVYQNGGYAGDTVPDQGDVVLNTWQTWNAAAGGWWDIPDTDGPVYPGDTDAFAHFGPPVHTLATIAAENPDAVICNDPAYGTFSISAGYGVAVTAYADNLTIAANGDSTSYNFEVSTSGDCKNGGWKALGYKNQGQCIAAHTNKGQKGKGKGPRTPHNEQ